MKTAVILSGLLASVALAQPHHHHRRWFQLHRHGHHEKRALVTEWVTETLYETVTEIIDESTTETIRPTKSAPAKAAAVTTTTTQRPGQFFEGASSAPKATVVSQPPAAAPPAPVVTPSPEAPAPAPAAPATSALPAPQVQVAKPNSAGSAASHTGELTFFKVGLGACGFNDAGKDQTENIVALSHLLMGEQSNGNPYCGRSITVSYGGKITTAIVRDKCMGCAYNNIDGTEKLFKEFQPLSTGRFEVDWWFND
jgi:hypothetical protein